MSEPVEKVKVVKFLRLTFKTNDGDRTTSIQIPYPRADLTKEIIEAAMDTIINTNVFYFMKTASELVGKDSAEIIERTVLTTDFDISA